MILMPMNRYVGVSARVTDPEERRALQEAGREIAQGRFGLVMRQAAARPGRGGPSELEDLRQRWEAVSRRAPTAHVPSVLEKPRGALTQLLDDYLPRGVTSLFTNDPHLAESWDGRLPTRYVPEMRLKCVPGLDKQLQGRISPEGMASQWRKPVCGPLRSHDGI